MREERSKKLYCVIVDACDFFSHLLSPSSSSLRIQKEEEESLVFLSLPSPTRRSDNSPQEDEDEDAVTRNYHGDR